MQSKTTTKNNHRDEPTRLCHMVQKVNIKSFTKTGFIEELLYWIGLECTALANKMELTLKFDTNVLQHRCTLMTLFHINFWRSHLRI